METIKKGPAVSSEGERLPENFKPFFWDVDFSSLDIRASCRFIISRLMEHGDETGLKFLMNTYDHEEMAQVVRTSRAVSSRSRAFWRVILDVKGRSSTPSSNSSRLCATCPTGMWRPSWEACGSWACRSWACRS